MRTALLAMALSVAAVTGEAYGTRGLERLWDFQRWNKNDQQEIQIKKCLVRAGKTDNSDMIVVLGQADATEANFTDANYIEVTIDSNDMVSPLVETFLIDEMAYRRGVYNYARRENASLRKLKYDTRNGKFNFTAKNADLTGLGCPVSVKIEVGDYIGTGEAGENIVNGPKKLIPIQLMMGVKNILRVDKRKVKFAKKASSDSVMVKGAFTLEDPNVDMSNPVIVSLGGESWVIGGGEFFAKQTAEVCKNVNAGNGIVSATFDFVKCSFTINVKKAFIIEYGLVDFSVNVFGTELVSGEPVNLGPKRTYALEELRMYDALGAWWNYQAQYTVRGMQLNESGTGSGTVSVGSSPEWVNGHECSVVTASSEGVDTSTYWYTDANGTHEAGWGSINASGAFDMTMESVTVAPAFLRIGQRYTDSGTFEGTYDVYDPPHINVDWFRGQVKSACRLLGHQELSVPAGTFDTVKCGGRVNITGQMYVRIDENGAHWEGIFKYKASINQTWWGASGVGIVKGISKMSYRLSARGFGSASIKITETDELTDYGG